MAAKLYHAPDQPEAFSYTLDENERQIVIATAQGRHGNARKNKRPDNRVDGRRDPLWIDLEGALGEFVFGKVANLFVDLRTTHEKTPIEDFIAPNGDTIDVKATRYADGKLLVPLSKDRSKFCDWYALIVHDWEDIEKRPTGKLVGGAHCDLMTDKSAIKKLGKNWTYLLTQDQLIPPDKFLEELTRYR